MSEEISREEIAALLARGSEGMTSRDLFSQDEIDKVIEDIGPYWQGDPCKDAISRQAAYDLMRSLTRWCVRSEDGKFNNVGLLYDDVMFGIDKLPSVTPNQVPCEDAISRQLVIKAIYDYNSLINIAQAVRELPPVQPIRPRGHWIFEEGDEKTCFDGYVCSACNKSFHTHVPYFAEYEFCPHCGADMRESEEQA